MNNSDTSHCSKKNYVPLTPLFFWWGISVSILTLTLTLWLQNLPLIYFILFESGATTLSKISILTHLYLGLFTNFTPLAMVATLMISILSGVNAGLLALYIQKTKSIRTLPSDTSLVQMTALVSAVFGIGCASCGSIILTAVLLQLGAGGLLFLLPFHGQEFALLAVGLLGYSARLLWKKINQSFVCT